MKTNILSLAIAASLITLSGCATIVNGTHQDVLIQTANFAGTEISGADCAVSNKDGAWAVKTPGTVNVRRSHSDLLIKCQKPGATFADTSRPSSPSALVLLGGGLIGIGVDAGSGAMWNYPEKVTVSGISPSADNK